jgi:osmotically-inducible protein OsmY
LIPPEGGHMRKTNGLALTLVVLVIASACNGASTREATSEPGQPQARQADGSDDPLITTTIQAKYYRAPAVKGHRISVDSENGVVTLRGKVDTEAARQQAVALAAKTTGVSRVEDQLTVSADGDRTIAGSVPTDAQSPGWITAKIQAQYYMHPALKPWNIDVVAAPNGHVALVGVIDNAVDRAEAVRIARDTDGVTGVTDNLRVRGELAAITAASDPTLERIADSSITAKIQSRYFVDDDLKGRDVDVDTKNGVVTLSGTVNSAGERLQAAAVARNTDGVTAVNDELMIDRRPRTAPGSGAVKGSVGTAGQIQDAWITTKIRSTFILDDRIRARNIDVDTKNGVVTLKGTVATEDARKAAESLATESEGVRRVVNQLSVDPGVA